MSVNDEKGDVSDCASHPRSCDGIDCRGKRAACVSTAEKSRHFKQAPWPDAADTADAVAPFVVPAAALFGFDASSFERSGLDEAGTGGGVDSGRAVGTAGVLEAELKPIVNADLLGAAGLTLP